MGKGYDIKNGDLSRHLFKVKILLLNNCQELFH